MMTLVPGFAPVEDFVGVGSATEGVDAGAGDGAVVMDGGAGAGREDEEVVGELAAAGIGDGFVLAIDAGDEGIGIKDDAMGVEGIAVGRGRGNPRERCLRCIGEGGCGCRRGGILRRGG